MKDRTEDRARTIDTACKVVATVAVVVGGFIGLVNYLSTRENEIFVRELEASKPALETRLNMCINISSAAATIATSENPQAVKDAKDRFEGIFWGPLGLIEDQRIIRGATAFDECLKDSSKCQSPLRNLSHNISLSCGASLGKDWGFIVPSPPTNLRATVE